MSHAMSSRRSSRRWLPRSEIPRATGSEHPWKRWVEGQGLAGCRTPDRVWTAGRRSADGLVNPAMEQIYLSPPDVGSLERGMLLEAFDSNWVTSVGPQIDGFEEDLAALVGSVMR